MIIIIVTILKARAYDYYLTNMRVIEEYTFFGRTVKETTLDKITYIVFTQSLFGRIFNIGTIHIHTARTGFLGIDFRNVKDPLVVRGLIINAKDAYTKEKEKEKGE